MLSNELFAGFNSHPRLEGTHAILSPSNPAWLRYTPERLLSVLRTRQAAALGTELHETAARNIRRRIKLQPHPDFPTFHNYVNDAIDFEMTVEQTLFYTPNAYGHADTIAYDPYPPGLRYAGFLRIHDLKTGTTKVNFDQLYVYAAIFCLEYGIRPFRIEGELRLYAPSGVQTEEIDRNDLAFVYSTIKNWDTLIEENREEGLL